jgi:eukaryotic-like serine/threonine-protein kinase
MVPGALRDLTARLPLPLASICRRILHAKSPAERHGSAWSLVEATLRMATAGRLGLFLARGLEAPPEGRLARDLGRLSFPTTKTWSGLLAGLNEALAALPDAALVPLAADAGELTRRRPEWLHVAAFVDRASPSPDLAAEGRARGLLGFLELAASLAGQDPTGNAHGDLLLDALAEALASPALLGGLRLAHRVEGGWEELTGLAPAPLTSSASGVLGQLYLVGQATAIALSPFAVVREDALGREQVGFLNGTMRRTRRARDGSVAESRRTDYLDYATGELFSDGTTQDAVAALIARFRTDDTQDSSPLYEEQVLSAHGLIGDFELGPELGRGGMGVVYKARQLSTRRAVALKVLPPTAACDDVILGRFQREVEALQRCDHPNIVKVLTAGQDEDRHFYAMEYVDGADLRHAARVLGGWAREGIRLREGHLAAAMTLKQTSTSAQLADTRVETASEPAPPVLEEGRPLELHLAGLFADAAAGLAHLHDAGILHRDIKPANLMLTSDGQRIVVMDLGIARIDDERALTSADIKILGTLAYMAPEQLQGTPDHRADIYSLGVTMYELFVGKRFFDTTVEEKLLQLVLTQDPVPPRRALPRLPRDLATVIETATAKQPHHRYASARDLEADLRAVAAGRPIKARPAGVGRRLGQWVRHHRTAVVAAALATVFAAGNLVAYQLWRSHRSGLCAGSELKLAGLWDDGRKEAMRQAFLATGQPYAAGAWTGVATSVDGYTTRWTAMHTDACQATRVTGVQSENLLDLRMRCLGDRLADVKALGDVFLTADAKTVEKAVQAAGELRELSACEDSEALTARVPPPSDPVKRAAAEGLSAKLAQARALQHAGKVKAGLAVAQPAAAEAQALGHGPLVAQALLARGSLEQETADYEAAEKTLYEAYFAAEAAGDDEVKARAATLLVYVIGQVQQRHQEALHLRGFAESVIARLGGDEALTAAWENQLGAIYSGMGEYDQALEHIRRGLAINERRLAPGDPALAGVLNNLGNVLDDKGDYAEAIAVHERVLAIRERALGGEHPDVARTLSNLAVVCNHKGETKRARALYERALAIGERTLGPEHPTVAMTLNNLASIDDGDGHYEQALATHRRALAIWEKSLGPSHPNVGISVNNVGEELRHLGRFDEALMLYTRALDIFEKALDPEHPVVSMVLSNMGQVHAARSDEPHAVAALTRALAICDKKTCDPSVVGEASFALARTLWPKDPAQARLLAVKARTAYEKQPGRFLDEVIAWIAAHP